MDVDPWAPGYEYQACTEVTLNAMPIQGKSLKHWIVYDPNYPGDANHITVVENPADPNDPNYNRLTIVMDADREVTAIFKCGSGAGLMLPMVLGVLGLFVWVRRRA